MSVLCDTEIYDLCKEGLVDPFDPSLINPASLDIRIGNNLIRHPNTVRQSLVPLEGRLYKLNPKEFVLIESLETFSIPDDICAQFILKSSRGREGFQHCLAGFCDPGWHGSKLTMEIYNVSDGDLEVYPGLRIGQLRFDRMSARPSKNYSATGRYNNDSSVRSSKG